MKRRCGLMGCAPGETPVWAKEGAVYFQCPESLMTGEIHYWLSLDALMRAYSNVPWLEMPAVDCDALQALWRQKEREHGKH